MKQLNKIIKISLILLLFMSITISTYAETRNYTGSLDTINARIKEYLQNAGYDVDKNKDNYTFTGAGSKSVLWLTSIDGEGYRFVVNIKVTEESYTQSGKTYNYYKATITSSVRSTATGKEQEIDDWKEEHKHVDTPVDHTAGEIIDESKNFVEMGENAVSPGISPENLQKLSNTIYNILLVVGIALAVVIAAILGIKFITGGIEAQVDVKKALVPYIAGCVVIFGAFIIWKIVLQVLNSI